MPFRLPENLLLLGRAVAMLSGMCSGLEPNFNVWTAVASFASVLLTDEKNSTFDTIVSEGTNILKTLIALPARADRVLTQMERGEFAVRTPRLDFRVRGLEHAVRRASNAIIFGALLIAGAVTRAGHHEFSNWMLAAVGISLLGLMFSGRGRHPGA